MYKSIFKPESHSLIFSLVSTTSEKLKKNYRILLLVPLLLLGCKRQHEEHLHPAVNHNNPNEVQALLNQPGIDIEVKDGYGRTALHLAVEKGAIEIIRRLIESGANLEAQDEKSDTPLHWAASKGSVEVIRLLLKSNANVGARNSNGKTPLHLALINGHEEAAKLLIAPVILEAQDEDGQTPLHWAALKGSRSVFQCLLNVNANVGAKNSDGKTPLDLLNPIKSDKNNDLNKLSVADPDPDSDPDSDPGSGSESEGETDLHRSIRKGNRTKAENLLQSRADINVVVTSGNNRGYKPIHVAAKYNRSVLIERLLDYGENTDARVGRHGQFDRYTPLHIAAGQNHIESMDVLIRRGADLQARDINGATPLHVAAMEGSVQAVEKLLDIDLNLKDLRDQDGYIPLDLAKRYGREEVVLSFRNRGIY